MVSFAPRTAEMVHLWHWAACRGDALQVWALPNHRWSICWTGTKLAQFQKVGKKWTKKMQMNSFGQFLSLCCFVRHSCMCSKREKMKHSPSEEKLFLGLFRQSPKRTKKIHPKSKWTFFAGLLGCSTWQQVSASGTEEKRRKMRKKKKIPSLHIVNCGKKVWNKFTKIPNGPSLPVSSAVVLGNKCLHPEQKA